MWERFKWILHIDLCQCKSIFVINFSNGDNFPSKWWKILNFPTMKCTIKSKVDILERDLHWKHTLNGYYRAVTIKVSNAMKSNKTIWPIMTFNQNNKHHVWMQIFWIWKMKFGLQSSQVFIMLTEGLRANVAFLPWNSVWMSKLIKKKQVSNNNNNNLFECKQSRSEKSSLLTVLALKMCTNLSPFEMQWMDNWHVLFHFGSTQNMERVFF